MVKIRKKTGENGGEIKTKGYDPFPGTWLIDWIEYYVVSAIFQPFNGGLPGKLLRLFSWDPITIRCGV